MKSILDVEISRFNSYRSTTPALVNLLKWLQSEKYKADVLAIRKIEDKAERNKRKAGLPAITPTGVFKRRKKAGLLHHSGFMQFDIDGVTDPEKIKLQLSKIQNVAYCGLSVSGRGVWGLIPIIHPKEHKQYFLFIEKAFAGLGITIDKSCKDIARLRGASYDSSPYFNHSAKPLDKFYRVGQSPTTRKYPFKQPDLDEIIKWVELCLSEIEARETDITALRNDWLAIGFGFANVFGEDGRSYYHRVSQFYPGYGFDEADEQYNKCLKSNYDTGLGCFFKRCMAEKICYKQLEALTPEYWNQ